MNKNPNTTYLMNADTEFFKGNIIEYYTNLDKGVTVAVMTGCEADAMDMLVKHNVIDIKSLSPRSKGYLFPKHMLMPNRFTGKAKLAEGDKFNFKEGREIARKKLLEKYYASLRKACIRFSEHHNNIVSRTDEIIEKLQLE